MGPAARQSAAANEASAPMKNSGRLYHRVPDPMFGKILYPLNRLAEINPALASAHAEKYRGRENLMAVRLPILDCLWNDALHLSPVHPAKIKTALLESGYPEKELGLRRFFAVDPRTLKPGRAVFFRNSKDTQGKYDFPEGDFSVFDDGSYRELDDVPEDQRRYFARIKNEGGRPLLWARTPHVFYLGELPIAGHEIVSW